MSGSWTWTAPWMVLAMLVACGGDGGPKNDGDDDDASDTDDTDELDDTDIYVGDTSSGVEGAVTGPTGPVEGANIRFCRGAVCRNGVTDGGGAYAFHEAPGEWHSLEIVPPSAALAVAFAPIELRKDEIRTVDLTVAPLDARSDLAPAPVEHELGEGLLVTVGAGDLEPPLFVDPAESVAGVRLSEAQWPPLDGLGAAVAVWYLDPFDHHATSDAGLPFRIRNDWQLEVGATLQVWVGSYTESTWLDAGTVTVGDDGYLTGTGGLPLMSTVALVDPG